MDFLKAEIANKKRKLQAGGQVSPARDGPGEASTSKSASPPAPSASFAPNKYLRRGEVERQRRREQEEEERRLREEKRRAREGAGSSRGEADRAKKVKSPTADEASDETLAAASSAAALKAAHQAIADAQQEADSAAAAAAAAGSSSSSTTIHTFNISPQEATRRLRAKGEPIRLFGETDKETRLRLRALELIEERGERFGQNDFMRALAGAESGVSLEQLERERVQREKDVRAAKEGGDEGVEKGGEQEGDGAKKSSRRTGEGIGMESLLDLGLIRKDMMKVYPIIYYTLKGLLEEWGKSLADRPIEVKMTTAGKTASAIQVQSSEYLKPLFKSLRNRSLPPDVLMRIAEIVHFVQKREYRNANDSYLQLSIGNAPWPIGVTMVGIHERSGREKIFASNVAHVLNDEVSRKYIQSLKRLMTFAQTKYPPSDVSMLMG